MGASSRAAVHLLQAAKVRALLSGRTFVSPDDVKRVARPVLRHRLTLQPDAYVEGFTTDDVLTTVLLLAVGLAIGEIAIRAQRVHAQRDDQRRQLQRMHRIAGMAAGGEGVEDLLLAVTAEPLVSADFIGNPASTIVDLTLTQVIDGDFVKILAWYDNEWGYANRLVEEVIMVGQSLEREPAQV